jgi:hypothetical protein
LGKGVPPRQRLGKDLAKIEASVPFNEDHAPGLESAVIRGTSRALEHGLDGQGRGRGLAELQR